MDSKDDKKSDLKWRTWGIDLPPVGQMKAYAKEFEEALNEAEKDGRDVTIYNFPDRGSIIMGHRRMMPLMGMMIEKQEGPTRKSPLSDRTSGIVSTVLEAVGKVPPVVPESTRKAMFRSAFDGAIRGMSAEDLKTSANECDEFVKEHADDCPVHTKELMGQISQISAALREKAQEALS